MTEREELEARIADIERVNVEWFVPDNEMTLNDDVVYIHSPISIVNPHPAKMSPKEATEILKRCGILDEDGEIVEAFRDMLIKRVP